MNDPPVVEDRPHDGVEAVDRAMAMLRCFFRPGEALTLATLAQRSGFYKSTILRLAASLIRAGMLRREDDGRYMLGPELRRLGALSRSALSLEPVIRPVLLQLRQSTCETASFYVAVGRDRICLYRENSAQSVRHHLDEGTRHPLTSGAAGLVLLHYGKNDRSAASRELAADGAIVSRGGRDPNLAAVAVPIVNGSDELVGALTVSGLISRFTPTHIAAARCQLIAASAMLRLRLPARDEIAPHGFES